MQQKSEESALTKLFRKKLMQYASLIYGTSSPPSPPSLFISFPLLFSFFPCFLFHLTFFVILVFIYLLVWHSNEFFSLSILDSELREQVAQNNFSQYLHLYDGMFPYPFSPSFSSPLTCSSLTHPSHPYSTLTSFAVMVEKDLQPSSQGYNAILRAFVKRQDLPNSLRVLRAMRTRNVSVASDYGVYNLVLLFAVQQKRVDECIEVLRYSTDTVTSEVLEIIR